MILTMSGSLGALLEPVPLVNNRDAENLVLETHGHNNPTVRTAFVAMLNRVDTGFSHGGLQVFNSIRKESDTLGKGSNRGHDDAFIAQLIRQIDLYGLLVQGFSNLTRINR